MNGFLQKRVVKTVFSLFAIVFAIFVLGFLLYQEKDELMKFSWNINYEAIILSFILYLIDFLLAVWVWSQILKKLGSEKTFWQHFRSYTISNIAKRLPGTIWYVVWRNEQYQKEGISRKITTFASGIEFVVSIVGGIFAVLIFGISIIAKVMNGYFIFVIIIFILMIIIILSQPKITTIILNNLNIDKHLFTYKLLLSWIVIFFLVWVVGGCFLFSLTNIIFPIGIENIGFFIGSWSLIGLLSYLLTFLPTNFGFNEIGLSLLLSLIMQSSFAVVIAIFARVINLLFEIIIAFVSWLIEIKNSSG